MLIFPQADFYVAALNLDRTLFMRSELSNCLLSYPDSQTLSKPVLSLEQGGGGRSSNGMKGK